MNTFFINKSTQSQRVAPSRLPHSADFARVARELLSANESRRYLANELLFNMAVLSGLNQNDAQSRRLMRESSLLMQDREIFLPALLSYWARTMEVLQTKWMASFTLPGEKNGSTPEHSRVGWISPSEQHYPVTEPCEDGTPTPSMPLLLGMACWLKAAVGPADAALLPQLIACLNHPESICQGDAVEMIGAIGVDSHAADAFKPALHALQRRVAEKGVWHRPFTDGEVIAGIIGNNVDVWLEMAREITVDCSLSLVQGYCGCFRQIDVPASALVDRLLAISANIPRERDEKLCELLTCTAELARKSGYCCSEVRERLLPLVNSKSTVLRRAAATGLGDVACLPEDETLLLQLSTDKTDWVRLCAHQAARCITTPSPQLIEAVARDLNEFGMCDGLPHDEVVETLAGWGSQITPAFKHIRRWLKEVAANPFNYERLKERELELIGNLGEDARPLLPLLQKYEEMISSDQEDDNDGEEADIEDEETEDMVNENDPDFLQQKVEALKVIRKELREATERFRTLDDSDDTFDHDALAAVKAWEKRATPVCEKLLQQFERGEKSAAKDTSAQLKQLADEGQTLLNELILKSMTNIFGDDEIRIGDDEEMCARQEALRLSFIQDMGVEDVGVADQAGPDDEFDPKPRLRELIERLRVANTSHQRTESR